MAFSKAQHEGLQRALQCLRPDAHDPSRDALSGNLLDTAFASATSAMKAALSDEFCEFCTLVSDGRTDINGCSIINYVTVSPKGAYFLEVAYNGVTRQCFWRKT